MATLKYWVRYQTGSPISNIGWNTSNVDHIFNVTTQSGITSIPINTWYQIADSNIDESLVSQSYFDVYSELQYNSSINAAEILCFPASVTASNPSTISLSTSSLDSGSFLLNLTGIVTGSYLSANWSNDGQFISGSNYTGSIISQYNTQVSLSFDRTGIYSYKLSVLDFCGNTNSASVYISIPSVPVPSLINFTSSVPQYSTMSYQITSSGNPTSYSASAGTSSLHIITTTEAAASQSSGWNGTNTLILNTLTGGIYGVFTNSIPIGNYNINIFSTNIGGIGSGSLLISIVAGLGYGIFGASSQRWSDSPYGLPYYNSGTASSDLINSQISNAFPLASNGTYIQNSVSYVSGDFGISLLPIVSDAFQLSADFKFNNNVGYGAGSYNWGFALLDSNNTYMVGTEILPGGPSGSFIEGCVVDIGVITNMSSIGYTNINAVSSADVSQSVSTPTPVTWSMKNGVMDLNFLGKSLSYNFSSSIPGRIAIYTQYAEFSTNSLQFSNISVVPI
jgi:type IV secretory pathway VirB2 component (pilin)